MKEMKSPSYSEVIEKILFQAICPRCGASVSECAYDVLMINSERIVLELDCENCESILTINGAFQRKPKTVRQHKKESIVSPETVRGVGKILKEFRGDNIQDLLKK